MLLLHTDVFLATGEIVLQRAFGELRAGPGPLQIAAAVLLHCDPLLPGGLHPRGLLGWLGGSWRGRSGEEGGRRGGKWGRGRSTNLRLSASPALVRTSR